MRRSISLCALMIVFFFCGGVKAQSTPPLEECPGYIGANPVALELSWAAGCFLQAIHDKNKTVITAIAPGARCSPPAPCDGILDEDNSHFIFGPVGPHLKKRTLFDMVTKAKSVTVTFDRSGDIVHVNFIPRPGKAKDTLSVGWMTSFFACDFKLDRERGVWTITNGFCFNESDAFSGGGEESDTPEKSINFNEQDPDSLIIVWKPKKQSSGE